MEQLHDAESIEDYEQLYKYYSSYCSQAFLEYFDKSLNNDLKNHAARFVTCKFSAFAQIKTVTNNISESMNKLIKEQNFWKELPIDAMVLALFYMQSYYIYEFRRAEVGFGNYCIKNKFKENTWSANSAKLPHFMPIEKILEHIKEKKFKFE